MTEPTQPVIPASPELYEQIAAAVEGVTAEQVSQVAAGLNLALAAGDPEYTIRINASTGQVAQRVNVGGWLRWRITNPDGTQEWHIDPTLPNPEDWTLPGGTPAP